MYAEARNTQYKIEETTFAKNAQGESLADVLKWYYRKLKSDIESLLTEMTSRKQTQQENTLKEMSRNINEFFKKDHKKVTATVEGKLSVFIKK